MKLEELIDVVDFNRGADDSIIQICGNEWDDVALEAPTSSRYLIPFYDCRIVCMAAMSKDAIRVDIEKPDSCFWEGEK